MLLKIKIKRFVKAINENTKEVTYFNSLNATQQHLKINAGVIKMVCKNINDCKSGISKNDNCKYTFEYVQKDDLPESHKKIITNKIKKNSVVIR